MNYNVFDSGHMGPGQFCVRYLRTFVESFAENSLKLDLFHSKPVLVWRHGLCQRLLFSTVQLDCNVQSIKDWQYCSILHIAYIPHYIAYCTHYTTPFRASLTQILSISCRFHRTTPRLCLANIP